MKRIHMQTHALTEIYTQKMLHQAHIKKLGRIRQQRKSNIGFNDTRLASIQNLKENKNKSFVHKFNQHSNQINRQNLRLLSRLQKTKPYFRYTSQDNRYNLQKSRESASFVTPFIRKQHEQADKQNMRLSQRVNSMFSSLNQKNLLKDFVRSQRIKQRITHYTAQNNKITLKSQKYIANLSQSNLSNASQRDNVRSKIKSTVANYYKKEDIVRNKVQNAAKSLVRVRNKTRSILRQNDLENKPSFFTTQPQKNVGLGINKRK